MEKPTSWFLSLTIEVTQEQVEGKSLGELTELFAQGIDTPIGKSKSCKLYAFADSQETLDRLSQNDSQEEGTEDWFLCPYCAAEYYDDYLAEGPQEFECDKCEKMFIVTKCSGVNTYFTEKLDTVGDANA